jgi:hypothetical protein
MTATALLSNTVKEGISLQFLCAIEKTKTLYRSRYGMGEVKDGEGNT